MNVNFNIDDFRARYNRNYQPPRRRTREKEQEEQEVEQEVEQVEEYEADFESEEEYLNHLNNKEEDEVDGDGEEEVNDCFSIFWFLSSQLGWRQLEDIFSSV